jgi:hypothetical protein
MVRGAPRPISPVVSSRVWWRRAGSRPLGGRLCAAARVKRCPAAPAPAPARGRRRRSHRRGGHAQRPRSPGLQGRRSTPSRTPGPPTRRLGTVSREAEPRRDPVARKELDRSWESQGGPAGARKRGRRIRGRWVGPVERRTRARRVQHPIRRSRRRASAWAQVRPCPERYVKTRSPGAIGITVRRPDPQPARRGMDHLILIAYEGLPTPSPRSTAPASYSAASRQPS